MKYLFQINSIPTTGLPVNRGVIGEDNQNGTALQNAVSKFMTQNPTLQVQNVMRVGQIDIE